jgi:RNA polymerase sigma factor (sigma-70 family)
MADDRSPESTFLEHLPLIDRITSFVGRRNGLQDEDAADFRSWVVARLIEDDYAPIRKFRGASALGTYLSVVIAMLARDYRTSTHGRWRPSAAARREGDLAVRLESLVYRSRYTLAEAGHLLRTSGSTKLRDRELAKLLARMPIRAPLRPVMLPTDALAAVAGGEAADHDIETATVDQQRQQIQELVDACIAEFAMEDRVLLRMRFWQDLSVADIARATGMEQKPLYRRLDRLLASLRGRLQMAGIDKGSVRALVEGGPE